MDRTPVAVLAIVAVVLVVAAAAQSALTDDSDGGKGGEGVTPVAEVVKRLEGIRGQRFRKLPKPQTVTPQEARAEITADASRPEVVRQLKGSEALLSLLGLIPPGTDMRELTLGLFDGGAVAGYYNPRNGQMRMLDLPKQDPGDTEIVLAHELNHGLDDQIFGLDNDRMEAGDDGSVAYSAMVEGTATAVMVEYLTKYMSLADVKAGPDGLEGVPPFVRASLMFSYMGGLEWVQALREKGGWPLVDVAFRTRPPVSSEQIIDPDKWLKSEPPLRVRLPRLGKLLGPGARRLAAGTFGAYQLRQMIAVGDGPDAERAAAGWGGDRYELWRSGQKECGVPCVARDTLVMRWRWDTPKDRREFLRSLRIAIPRLFKARRTSPDSWSGRGGAVALRGGDSPVLVAAPTAAGARRLVAALSTGGRPRSR